MVGIRSFIEITMFVTENYANFSYNIKFGIQVERKIAMRIVKHLTGNTYE